ncbi:MAG: hypothetical protein SFZ23_06395 [Planctomycetota bacterium]|nr:hypothetical protein [Planctomycetota bacterium]
MALSAVGVGAAAIMLPELVPGAKRAWTLAGFELIALVAAILGILFSLGRFRTAPSMALVCVAGTVFSAAVLGFVGVQGRMGETSLMPWLLTRMGLVAAIAGVAAAVALGRSREAIRYFLRAVLVGVPTAAILGFVALRFGVVEEFVKGLSGPVLYGGGAVVALVVGGLICASVHLLIRAFEVSAVNEPTA